MISIDQYVQLFLKEKAEEMEEFKDYIRTSTFSEREISHNEWKSVYLNWTTQQDQTTEKSGEMPEIYLSVD